MEVYLFLAEGFEELEVVTPVDLLRRAGISVNTVSISGKKEVTGAHGITLHADLLFEQCDFTHADLLMLPGGMPGTKNLGEHQPLCQLLTEHNEKGKRIGAICAAPSVLGQLHLLEGKKATCYPGFESYLGDSYVDDSVVVDGNVITAKGPGVAYDYALCLIYLLKDKDTADRVASQSIYNI